ncbi:MAG: peroxiredoxin [Verrucomicrobia bacterium]|nr:peroxiredoxin [Verrucomicrobiota bacterium]
MKRTVFFLLTILSVQISQTLAAETKLKLGDPIPNVSGTTQGNSSVRLPAEANKGYLLVYFYPKAMTPGCTAQACSLRDAYSSLTSRGVKVIGVSADNVNAQKEFQQKEHLPFTLIADPEHRVSEAFGVPIQMGQYDARQAYLFKDGKLVWVDTHASTSKQAQDVLSVVTR